MFNTPILLITFNRPRFVAQSLACILKQSPDKLYVFQDGPRQSADGSLHSDVVNCNEVRKLISDMTKNYKGVLHTFYSETNLGCGHGPYEAISWLFKNEEMGIILEDDCMAHPDFFSYCAELLNKYKDNPRICHIGANNYGYKMPFSFTYTSGHHETWGWASWRRTWDAVTYDIADITKKDFRKIVKCYYRDLRQQEYWWKIFDMVKKDRMQDSCWDYQYMFSCWKRHMMAIAPCSNLVSNIGSGEDATHTKGVNQGVLSCPLQGILPLSYPKEISLDIKHDDFMMRKYIIPYQYGLSGVKGFIYRLNFVIKQILGHEGPWLKKSHK